MPSTAAKIQPAPVAAAGPFSSPEKRTFVLCLLLVVATLAIYNPVNRNGFVNFDDDHYITGNPHVLAGLHWQTVEWAFTNFYEANWHPLTWISHALDCQLFGLNPAGHHYVNLVLHAINVVLLFLLLQSATGITWRSLMVGALFALHPVNVESVAWASERKNLLSMMFLLLAMQVYAWYARHPAVGRYALVALLFACGLMSKPQIITLPFVLLLWDYWPLRRIGANGEIGSSARLSALLIEKVPLFLLSLISGVVTMLAQKAGGAIHNNMVAYAFPVRLENAIVSYSRYLANAFWPAKLSPFYAHPLDLLHFWHVIASGLFLLAITALVMQYRSHGYLVTGWFWFLGTLVPMIGLIQVGEQAMADRYAYLPFIGLFLMVCWGLSEFAESQKIASHWLAIPSAAILLTFGFLTYRQIGYWYDSETLWSHALRVTSVRSYKVHFNLAVTYDQQGRYDQAIQQFRAAIDPRDDDPQIHLGLGIYDQRHGHMTEAIEEYQSTLRLASDAKMKTDAYANLGSAYRQAGDSARAKDSFTAALQLDPNKPMALIGLGLVAQKSGNYADAISRYTHAMLVEPTAVGYVLLGRAQQQAGRPSEAQASAAKAQQLTGDWDGTQQIADELLAF